MGPATDQHRGRRSAYGLRGYRLFRIFGFEVKLNLTWLLFAMLIVWTLAAGFFPVDYPELSTQTYWWMGLAGAVGILFSIVFHELSHSLIARRFDLPIRGITLFIFGGVAEMEEEPASPKAEFLMAIAGPLASLLLVIVFVQLQRLALAQDWPLAIGGVLHYLAMINLVLAIFNLMPAFPLDGGRMLRAALWYWKKDLHTATQLASRIGSGFGLGMMILGGIAFLQGAFIGGMWWFLIGAFLRSAANTSYQQLLIKEMLSDKPVRRFMIAEPVTVSPDTTVTTFLKDYIQRHRFRRYPVVENGKLLGCIAAQDIEGIPEAEQTQHTVGDLLNQCSPASTVSPDTDAIKLISEMSRPEADTLYMVVENGQLVGVLSLKDLREIIAIKLKMLNP